MSKKLSVVVPAYNEYGNLKKMIPVLEDMLKKYKINSEVIIIDDGSTDKTWEIINVFSKRYNNICVFRNRVNLGLTEVFMEGFSRSKGDIIFFLPGDYECHPEEDIPKIMKKMDEGYDMVLGWRINRKGTKKISSGIYNWLVRLLFKVKIHDSNWVKMFKREVIQSFKLRSDWHRYLPIFASMGGYKLAEVKVRYYPRKYGKSKYGLKRLIVGLLDLIVIKFLLSFKKKPMLVFGTSGLISILLGAMGGLYLYYLHFVGSITDRPLIFLVILLIMLGIQLFALGFLGELLVDLTEKKRSCK